MTRTMYDAVTLSNVPTSSPQMVAGYVNGLYANMGELRSRFPNAVHVGITITASHNSLDAPVLDVETGDATPSQAVGWAQRQRSLGGDPTCYCNTSTWPDVISAFRSAGVAQPHYWVAQYDGDPTIPGGAVAKQYRGDVSPGYDVSSVVAFWPGIDSGSGGGGTPPPPPSTSGDRRAFDEEIR